MIDTVFDNIADHIISKGFKLAFEDAQISGVYLDTTKSKPFQIYINPVNFAIVAIWGDANERLVELKMYFRWKPKDQGTKDFIFSNIPEEYLGNTIGEYFVDDRLSKNPAYDEFSDKSCIAFAKLVYKRYIGSDNECVVNHKRIFENFDQLWKAYTVISDYCEFSPWDSSKRFYFVSDFEKQLFTYTLPKDTRQFNEQAIRSFIADSIRAQQAAQGSTLTSQKLRKALNNLNLPLVEFGLT
jgi:hypothetical protein